MSIRIISQQQLSQASNRVSIIREPELVILPNIQKYYTNRLQRIQTIDDNPLTDYLNFCSKIITAQLDLTKQPIVADIDLIIQQSEARAIAPLSIDNLALTDQWQHGLHSILNAVENINPRIDQVIDNIKKLTNTDLNQYAHHLLAGEFTHTTAEQTLFIWSALSVYYAQLANQLSLNAKSQFGEQRLLCPICHSHPVASIIYSGKNSGLRYLHCSLCESEWYVPRVKCTNCDNLAEINYYALDDELAAIKAETCNHCHSYLKIFNLERQPHLDSLIDDMMTLNLDIEMEKLGLAKSGFNPLFFSSIE